MRAPSAGCSHCARMRRESGAAIILAVLTLALVAGLASMVLRDYGAAVASLTGRHDQVQARLLARGAVDWARNVLAEDARRTTIDHFGESWTIRIPPTPVEDGEVSGELEELSGRFDLNSLVRGGVADPVRSAIYQRLLSGLGVAPPEAASLAASLIDWIDADNIVTPPDGAESDWYARMAPPRAAANAPLTDVDELRLVRGYSVDLVNRLRPIVTALPVTAPLNVNTASAEVLAAIVPGLGLDGARLLTAKRLSVPFKNLADFIARLPRADLRPDTLPLSVTSRYFIASGRARYGVATTRMQVLLDRAQIWPDIIWQKIL